MSDRSAPPPADVVACLRVLRALDADPTLAPALDEVERLVARLHRASRRRLRRDEALARAQPLAAKRACRRCDETLQHSGPGSRGLCLRCLSAEAHHRVARADLTGRVALVTGGRVKLGFELALRLLRDGAEVHVTTRRTAPARAAYAAVEDAADWLPRLRVHALDLRDTAALQRFCQDFRERSSLDILVHNAAQTLADEGARGVNSWTLRLGEVPADELLDVLQINAAAPFLLTQALLPALRAAAHADRYVISVVGADGQFGTADKTPEHPHVNASKAALSMMTRTSAGLLAREGIYLCCVDPGWFSLEQPVDRRAEMVASGLVPPLSVEEAAARVYHPVRRGLAGDPAWGVLLRDYQPAAW